MSTVNTVAQLNGMFKESYSDKGIENLIPEGVKLVSRIPFIKKEKQPGAQYHQPVVLSNEHGIAFGDGSGDAFALNAPSSSVMKDATIRGTEILLRSAISYTALSRSIGNNKAFEDASKHVVRNMMNSIARYLEILMLYGQVGIGAVASVSSNTITITEAEWAPGIWSGAEGMQIEIRDDVTPFTLRGSAKITSVNLDNRQFTVDVIPAGVVANDVIWFYGAYGKEMAGLHKIMTSTSTLFGIDSSQYNLWKGNQYVISPAAALSFNTLSDALARAVEKGLDSSVLCVVNPRTWSDLMTEQAALRRYDASFKAKEGETGMESLVFHSQNGSIEIISSIYCKEGYAYVFPLDEMMRVGSTDITFRMPGYGDDFFRHLSDNAGLELRCFSDQALFCHAPGKLVLISGIDNG